MSLSAKKPSDKNDLRTFACAVLPPHNPGAETGCTIRRASTAAPRRSQATPESGKFPALDPIKISLESYLVGQEHGIERRAIGGIPEVDKLRASASAAATGIGEGVLGVGDLEHRPSVVAGDGDGRRIVGVGVVYESKVLRVVLDAALTERPLGDDEGLGVGRSLGCGGKGE